MWAGRAARSVGAEGPRGREAPGRTFWLLSEVCGVESPWLFWGRVQAQVRASPCTPVGWALVSNTPFGSLTFCPKRRPTLSPEHRQAFANVTDSQCEVRARARHSRRVPVWSSVQKQTHGESVVSSHRAWTRGNLPLDFSELRDKIWPPLCLCPQLSTFKTYSFAWPWRLWWLLLLLCLFF